MKKILLVGAFVLGVSAVSFAQGPGRRTPDEQVANLKTQITGITDAQAAKLKVVYEAQSKSIDSLMNGGGMQGGFEGFQKVMTANDAKVKAILTPEQATAYQKQIDARNERFKQMGGN